MTAVGWAGSVTLTEEDHALARKCAEARQEDSKRHKYADRFGERSLGSDQVGALGEIAFARFLGVPWDCTVGHIGGATDVAGYEVRTVSASAYRLALKAKRNDLDDTRLVLVALLAGTGGSITGALVVGWASAATVRFFGDRRDPGKRGAPAWFLEDVTMLRRDDW